MSARHRGRMYGFGLDGEPGFRWRAGEVTRLESFSDAVFAFALTLLVVSLEVPKSFNELLQIVRGFAPFAVTFALLFIVWLEHCRFFRRYGVEDIWASILSAALLFFVLFYVYPLKFLFSMIGRPIETRDARLLFTIFGLGSACVSAIFVLLYTYAWRLAKPLQLNLLERSRTRCSLINNAVVLSFGLFSIMFAWMLPDRVLNLCGFIYFGIPVYFAISRRYWRRSERRLGLPPISRIPP